MVTIKADNIPKPIIIFNNRLKKPKSLVVFASNILIENKIKGDKTVNKI